MAAIPVDLTPAASTHTLQSVDLSPARSEHELRPVGPASWMPSKLTVDGEQVVVAGQNIGFTPPLSIP